MMVCRCATTDAHLPTCGPQAARVWPAPMQMKKLDIAARQSGGRRWIEGWYGRARRVAPAASMTRKALAPSCRRRDKCLCRRRLSTTGGNFAEGLNRWDDRSPRARLAPMRLKKAILSVMGRDLLKQAVQGLEIDDVDRRSVQKMNARLSRARRATPEYLLELLSEQDVKHVCELLSIDATGRRRTVVPRLLAAGRSPVPKRVATDPPEPASKGIPSRRDSPQVVAVPKMPSNTLYTVGYGGIPEPEEMTALLSEHGVEVLVDIRVRPFWPQGSVQQEEAGRYLRAGEVGRAGLSPYRRVGQREQGHRGNSTQGRGKGTGAVVG